MFTVNRLILICVLTFIGSVHAEFQSNDYEDDTKPWVEIEAKLPPYPKQENLIPFQVTGATANQFFVDRNSITVGSDGVVRYTLWIKSPQGANTVSYEGIRCTTTEHKAYAFGRTDGTWSNARSAKWSPIKVKDVNNHYSVLYTDYFCAGGLIVRNQREAINALQQGGHWRAKNF